MSTLSRDSEGVSLNSLQTGASGETGSMPSMIAHNDWEIAPMDIEIMRRDDGSPWELGAGAFGKVRRRGGVRGVMGALKPSTNPEPPARPRRGPVRKQICANGCPQALHAASSSDPAGASRPHTVCTRSTRLTPVPASRRCTRGCGTRYRTWR